MNATETISLLDYANDRENVVLFSAGVGNPGGSYCRLGDGDDNTADAWHDLQGVVDTGDIWQWDGVGNPRDWQGNTVYQMEAYQDAKRWESLGEE